MASKHKPKVQHFNNVMLDNVYTHRKSGYNFLSPFKVEGNRSKQNCDGCYGITILTTFTLTSVKTSLVKKLKVKKSLVI